MLAQIGNENLSLIIPVHNEEENILTLALEIEEAFKEVPFKWEVIWVNDHSTDRTLHTLKNFILSHVHHSVIHLTTQSGQSAAILSGIYHASYPLIATLDGDGQNSPFDLITLRILLIKQDLLLAQGVRFKRHDSIIRQASSRIANFVRNKALGIELHDVGCAVRVFRREVLMGLPTFRGFHRFLPVLVSFRDPSRVKEAGVSHRPRTRGISKYGICNRLWVGIFDVAGVWWIKKRGFSLPPHNRIT